MTDRLLTAPEVADVLGLSASTVLDRFEKGDLPGFRLFGRKGGPVRFRLEEIEALIESWHVNGPTLAEEVAPVHYQHPTRGVVLQLHPFP